MASIPSDVPAELPEKQWARWYTSAMVGMVCGYGGVLVGTIDALHHIHGGLRYPVSLLPLTPFVGISWVVARHLTHIDEMQRELLLRIFTFGFFGTAIATFGYGFLEIAGAPKLSMFSVWPLMGALWIVGGFVVPRRPPRRG
jgi:hypothetical protein